jgi:hypothetical protein
MIWYNRTQLESESQRREATENSSLTFHCKISQKLKIKDLLPQVRRRACDQNFSPRYMLAKIGVMPICVSATTF